MLLLFFLPSPRQVGWMGGRMNGYGCLRDTHSSQCHSPVTARPRPPYRNSTTNDVLLWRRRGPVLTGVRVSGLVARPQREGPLTGSEWVNEWVGRVSVWDCDGSMCSRYVNRCTTNTIHLRVSFPSFALLAAGGCWHYPPPVAPTLGPPSNHVGSDESTHPDPPLPQQPSRTSAERFVGLLTHA